MGEKNSSATRVAPVFDLLLAKDATGNSWLARLLSLPGSGNVVRLPQKCSFTIRRHGWGKHEKQLPPPVALLSWILRHPREPLSGGLSQDPQKAAVRRQWIQGAESRIAEGLNLLTCNPNGEDWHIFEGPTQPDVYIETDDLVVVIEGKRTERKPTTVTKWMAARHQMLRHLDCAWEARGQKTVFGFFIVEGLEDVLDVPDEWRTFSHETTSAAAVASSLPHRGPEEQSLIASSFAGVTTWQKVVSEFRDLGLAWASLPDKVSNHCDAQHAARL